MSGCPHPVTAQHVDRSRGTVTCTICGEVVVDQQLELDPLFPQGERPNAALHGARSTNLRALGQPRPVRTTVHVTPVSRRPSVEVARRSIFNIARQLEISSDMAEQATGIYKIAVTSNAIVGARVPILAACLYAVCRREGTNHMLYDFADATHESPYVILRYMSFICRVTHTAVPPVDVSLLVYRFAEQLDLKEQLRDVAVCALKLLRCMKDDWIEYGRRPLGVVAAALVVACHVFGIVRTPEQLCGMVRLTATTVHKRLVEFMATPTASLASVDEYTGNSGTKPPAFVEDEVCFAKDDELRELAALYYDLVAEAKRSEPATPIRCEKWKAFILKHAEINNLALDPSSCRLENFTPKEQLTLLGLPHAVPLSQSATTATDSGTAADNGGVKKFKEDEPMMPATHPVAVSLKQLEDEAGVTPSSVVHLPVKKEIDEVASLPVGANITEQLAVLHGLIQSNPDVKELLQTATTGGAADASAPSTMPAVDHADGRSAPAAFADDGDRALFHTVYLPTMAEESSEDLNEYIIDDPECRVQLEKAAKELHGAAWERGKPRSDEEVGRLLQRSGTKKRAREPLVVMPTLEAALAKTLKGKAASTIHLSQINLLIPGLTSADEGTHGDDREGSEVDGDWY